MSALHIRIALALARGGSTQAEIAERFAVSPRTVSRISGSAWARDLREDVLESTVEAAKAVFEGHAEEMAKRLIEIAKENGDSREKETSRKACIDVLEAAGVEMTKDGGIPKIRIT